MAAAAARTKPIDSTERMCIKGPTTGLAMCVCGSPPSGCSFSRTRFRSRHATIVEPSGRIQGCWNHPVSSRREAEAIAARLRRGFGVRLDKRFMRRGSSCSAVIRTPRSGRRSGEEESLVRIDNRPESLIGPRPTASLFRIPNDRTQGL